MPTPNILLCHVEIIFCGYIGVIGQNQRIQKQVFNPKLVYVRIAEFDFHKILSKLST